MTGNGLSSPPAGLLEEYEWLRREIEDWSRVRNQFVFAALAATAVVLAAGFSTRSGWVFLAPLVLWVPCAYVCLAERRGILTLSGYLRVFVESKVEGIKWESRLSSLQASHGLPGIKALTEGLLILQVGVMLLLFVLAGAHMDWHSSRGPYALVLVVTVLLTARPLYQYARGMADREKLMEDWRRVQQRETVASGRVGAEQTGDKSSTA